MANIRDTFAHLGLNPHLIRALNDMKYTKPSPIQEICIPYLLQGRDVLGMAQTGSGKTAAFSLPLLHNIQLNLKAPQILVLAPTRELAVQVAEAFTAFSKYIKGIMVLALYGGQRYDVQLKGLVKGPQIVVGTPGRLLDHLKRKTLILSKLSCIVLDEADEMLRMGFLEDVENIMKQIPKNHQTALFSATMPELIRRISRRFMKTPKEIKIQSNITNCPDIKQSFWMVNRRKTDALIRFLEIEDFSATIIFVRTKNATLEISEALEKSGYNSAALNGDMNQLVREQTLEKLKDGRLDILIATDVAARGLDVDRISLVINYDIPMDAESYIHRIGRTGRAGRKGKALLFVEHRERRLLRNIERIVRFNISEVNLPKNDLLVERRLKKISETIQKELQSKDLEKYRNLLPKIYPFSDHLKIENLAAVLLKMAQGDRPLIVPPESIHKPLYRAIRTKEYKKYSHVKNNKFNNFSKRFSNNNVDLYRIEVGRDDGVEVRHIVGAVANEGNIDSSKIGNVKLFSSYATIELSKGLSKDLLYNFKHTRILNKFIRMKLLNNPYKKENFSSNDKFNRYTKFNNQFPARKQNK